MPIAFSAGIFSVLPAVPVLLQSEKQAKKKSKLKKKKKTNKQKKNKTKKTTTTKSKTKFKKIVQKNFSCQA
jgi:hypothetical protein